MGAMEKDREAYLAADLVERINVLREILGVSIPELAECVGLERTYLWRVLHGQRPGSPEILGPCLIALGQILMNREAA